MFLKRQIPLFIVMAVGLLTFMGHFINQEDIQNFINNDSTQWFDIIASFAIFLGALNMIKLQIIKIIKKQKNWQYSILAVGGFFFAIFAGFIFRGSNYIVLHDIPLQNQSNVAIILSEQLQSNVSVIEGKILSSNEGYEIDTIFITATAAEQFIEPIRNLINKYEIKPHPWGPHVNQDGSLFSWMYKKIFTPLSATMFALLAFFVASASYRAFRIRNFEATLLLVAGIILMLGRVPVGELIPWWIVIILIMFGFGAIIAPWVKDRKSIFGIVTSGIIIFCILGYFLGWSENTPSFLNIPAIQAWIFDYPTAAGSRALMIGVALGIIGTTFRIMIGIERSFLGE